MIILETERLQLAEWQLEDIPKVLDMFADPETMRYIGTGQPYTPEIVEQGMNRMIAHYQKHGYGMWKMIFRPTGQIIGQCGLKFWDELGETEVGYLLRPEYRGQGLVTEAAQAVIRYSFEKLNLPHLLSIAYTANLASIRVMERCGLHFDRPTEFHDRPAVVYKIEQSEYAAHTPPV